MNYVLIIILAALVVSAIYGWNKGFVDMMFGAVSMTVALILAVVIGPKLGEVLQNNGTIMDKLTTTVSTTLNLEDMAIELPEPELLVENLNLPIIIKEKLASAEFAESLKLDEMAEDASAKMAAGVAEFLAKTILGALCFVLVFIIAMILLYALNKVLDVFAKLPLLKQANKLVGMALGLVQGILLVWLFFALVTVISGTEFGQTMFRYINESKLLSFLYTPNLPMNSITKTVADLF